MKHIFFLAAKPPYKYCYIASSGLAPPFLPFLRLLAKVM